VVPEGHEYDFLNSEPSPQDLVHELYERVYGMKSTALPKTPKAVWEDLLYQVTRMREELEYAHHRLDILDVPSGAEAIRYTVGGRIEKYADKVARERNEASVREQRRIEASKDYRGG
jgi:hypothetical protein